MDSSIEAKINKFSSSVMNEAQKKLDELKKEIQEKKSEVLDSKNDEFLGEAYEKIQGYISAIQKEDNDKVRNAEFDAKKALLKKREGIIEEVFETAKTKLEDFAKSDEYKTWLEEKLKKALAESGEGKKEIYMTERDKNLIGITEDVVPVSEKDFWGGVRVENLEKGILVDYSFYNLLEDQRGDFLSKSGLVID